MKKHIHTYEYVRRFPAGRFDLPSGSPSFDGGGGGGGGAAELV
jgi:hypothetical protein